MKLALRQMKQDSLQYRKEMEEHTRIAQQLFSFCLFVFFVLHSVVIHLLNYSRCPRLYAALGLSVLQGAVSLAAYFFFKTYCTRHKKHILAAAYCNIFQVVILLELQYFLYDEYLSYTVIICIALCTALSILGHVGTYAAILGLSLSIDVGITIWKNYQLLHSHLMQIQMYIIDTVFLLVIAVGLNCIISYLKYRDFAARRQLLYLSERDSLTGLLNRSALEFVVAQHAGGAGLCAMILLDLDNFKALNDTLGHYEGDNCLRATAEELKALFSEGSYVSRLGGDEFIVFLPRISGAAAVMERARGLLEVVPRTYPHPAGDIAITCSVGLAVLPMDGDNLYEQLYKSADSAMYQSKAGGKNQVTIFQNEYVG